MANIWVYTGTEYTTEDEANAAVVARKSRLDNNPTDWVIVKELTGNADGWVVPSETLSDSEINSLDAAKHYSVAAVVDGGNDLGLTASEANAKVAEHRTSYARAINVNTISILYPPSNVDMSGYV
tara:strand:+ start:767 stop:1141 length:375 start_codon:yes stop_codon:yes gene_type:complete